MVNVYIGDKHMSINEVTPKEWDSLKAKGPDKPEDCLMSAQKPKTITGSLYHPADSMLDKQMFPEEDVVNHPAHYNKGGVEAIDYIEQQLSEGFKYYLVGNVYKYLHRWEYKDGLQDLKKAQWYLNRMISDIEDTT